MLASKKFVIQIGNRKKITKAKCALGLLIEPSNNTLNFYTCCHLVLVGGYKCHGCSYLVYSINILL